MAWRMTKQHTALLLARCAALQVFENPCVSQRVGWLDENTYRCPVLNYYSATVGRTLTRNKHQQVSSSKPKQARRRRKRIESIDDSSISRLSDSQCHMSLPLELRGESRGSENETVFVLLSLQQLPASWLHASPLRIQNAGHHMPNQEARPLKAVSWAES